MLPTVGWDVVVTPEEVVLTEANAWWSLRDPDGPSVEIADALRASIARRARDGSSASPTPRA